MSATPENAIYDLINSLPEKAQNRIRGAISNPSQTSLDLSSCGLQAQDGALIANLLNLIPRITTLNVEGNKIGDEGATALAENQTITTLNVRYNWIGAEGAAALAGNQTITTLNVRGNNIGPKGQRLIDEMIDRNRKAPLIAFRNQISVLGLGMHDEGSPLSMLPVELVSKISEHVANNYTFFGSPAIQADIDRNLDYPAVFAAAREARQEEQGEPDVSNSPAP